MKQISHKILAPLAALLILAVFLPRVFAQGTAFTYQGSLSSGGAPANGNYDLSFTLFSTNVSGNALAGPVTNVNIGVTNGLFTTILDFGPNVFNGGSNWLQIGVQTNGGTGFIPLSPRQQVTPTPYAILANSASNLLGSLSATQLAGTIAAANIANGTITSNLLATNSVGVTQLSTNVGVWTQIGTNIVYTGGNVGIDTNTPLGALAVRGAGITGQSGAITGTQTSGVGNSAGVVGLTTVPGGNGVIGESDVPLAGAGLNEANIGVFGLSFSTNGVGIEGSASATSGPVVGVFGQTRSPQGYAGYFQGNTRVVGPLVGGGSGNTVASGLTASTIAGGGASGFPNTILSDTSFIGAGNTNTIGSNSGNSFIGAGYNNSVLSVAGFLGGGNFNTIDTNSAFAVVGGGYDNTVSGTESVVAGGSFNTASGNNAFAAGTGAIAAHPGAFVWADTVPYYFSSSTSNSFNVRSTGGVQFQTGGAGMTIDGLSVLTGSSLVTNGAGSGNFFAASGAGANTTGPENTGVGSYALNANTSGGFNTALGQFALSGNTIGYQNTAVGQDAMIGNTNGDQNTALGAGALQNNINGDGNTAVGFQSLVAAGGNFNIALGIAAGYNVADGDNNIEIGNFGQSSDNAIIRIGSPGTQTDTYLAGFLHADGGYLTDIPATNLAGIVPVGALPSAVALTNAVNTFYGNQFITNGSPGSGPASLATLNVGGAIRARGGPINGYDTNNNGYTFGPPGDNDSGMTSLADGQVQFYCNGSEVMRIIAGGSISGNFYPGFIGIDNTNPAFPLVVSNAYCTGSSWVNGSDRASKKDIRAVNPVEVLEKVSTMPITEWQYKAEAVGNNHIGPMAQDFHAAFGLDGSDDKHISTVDEGGVALAAIQGLNQELKQKDAEIADLKQRLARIEKWMSGNGSPGR